jgi:F-type H+-transporting ATPase subunit delta
VSADVVSAAALDDKQIEALAKNLKSSLKKDVKVNVQVDESLLGGMIVKVGSKQIDSSIKTKLNRLTVAMKGAG